MKKIFADIMPIIVVLLFVIIMNGGDYFKKPGGNSDDVVLYIRSLEENIKNDQWTEAQTDYEKLSRAWEKIVPRIQFSVEKDEINAINENLTRLKAYLDQKDTSNALAELSEAHEHWINLNR